MGIGMAGPVARQPLVVDSSVSCLTAAPALAARGVKVVMRYYSRPGYPQTILSADEAKAIHDNGMAVGLVYQYFSGDIANFDTQSAHDAATACMNRDATKYPDKSDTIHHPKGTVIYFGVDGDLTGVKDQDLKKENIKTILNFFTVIGQDFDAGKAPFDIGVYGSGDVCERLIGAKLAKYGWMAGFSIGWTRTRDVYNELATPPHWHLFQNALEVRLDVPVDTSILNPRSGGIIGAFDKHGLIGPLDDSAIRTTLRFVAADQGATLFEAPEEHPLGTVMQNRMVSLLQPGPTWSKVETTFHNGNTGTTKKGYMRSALLAPIDRMA